MAAPQVSLEVVAGKAAGMLIPVEDELMIGRHAEGVGRLADDQEISRLHARVSLDGGFCAIEDLGSTNGTFVNGLRISTPQTLSDGDTVELGDTTLIVRRREAEAEVTETPEAAGPPEAAAPDLFAPPTPEPEPEASEVDAAEPPEAADVPPPPLGLRVEVDFAASTTLIRLDGDSAPIRLEYIDGAWRHVPPTD